MVFTRLSSYDTINYKIGYNIQNAPLRILMFDHILVINIIVKHIRTKGDEKGVIR